MEDVAKSGIQIQLLSSPAKKNSMTDWLPDAAATAFYGNGMMDAYSNNLLNVLFMILLATNIFKFI